MDVEAKSVTGPMPFDSPGVRLPNLRHLRAMQHVGACGSINRAAARMNISQPAVTQVVARLELLIAPDLFVRHPTGMYPTESGRKLLHRIDRIFDELDRALAAIMRMKTTALHADILLKSVQLDTLAALVHASSSTAAAASLGITRTAFKRNIYTLETRLDVILAFRDASRFRLTQAGERLARAAKLARREIELFHEEIASAAGRLRGQLSVGALPLARTYIVPKALILIGNRNPDFRLRLVEGSYEFLLTALQNGDIDIMVGTLREPAPTDEVVETRLFEDRLCIVGRADHPLAAGPEPRLDDLLDYPWIAPRLGSPARSEFDALFATRSRRPRQIFEVASHMSVRAILRESDTLALISRCQLRYEERDRQIVVLSDGFASRSRTIGYTMLARRTPTQVQSEFLEDLVSVVAAG